MKAARIIIPLCLGVALVLLSGIVGGVDKSSAADVDQLSELCSSVDGVGRCYAQAGCTPEGDVCSVAVMCEGAENLAVRSELYRLLSSFYGIGYQQVSVETRRQPPRQQEGSGTP